MRLTLHTDFALRVLFHVLLQCEVWNTRVSMPEPCDRWNEGGFRKGVRTMTRFVIGIVLFSCIFAVVTGIVIAAANLLI